MTERPQFDSRFLVGIEQVDSEHRQLFEIAGRVYDALSASDGGPAAARVAVAELLDYTARHFASEEALMQAAGYPDLAAHRALHAQLMLQTRDMEMRAEFDESSVLLELNRFLCSWLIDHIRASDIQFGEFLAARR